MYTLYISKTYYTQYKTFQSIIEAKAFYETLTLTRDYIVTIESCSLPSPIILQGA